MTDAKKDVALHITGKYSDGISFHAHEDLLGKVKSHHLFHIFTDEGQEASMLVPKCHNKEDLHSYFSSHGMKTNLIESSGNSAIEAMYHEYMTHQNLINEYGVKDTHAPQLAAIKQKVAELQDKITPARRVVLDEHAKLAAAVSKSKLARAGYGEVSRINMTSGAGDISKATLGEHKDTQAENPSDITLSFHPGQHPANRSKHVGISLKSSSSGNNKVKNPTGKIFDRMFGSQAEKMYSDSARAFTESLGIDHLPNSSTKGDSKGAYIKANGLEPVAQAAGRTAFSAIRDNIFDSMQNKLSESKASAQRVRQFIAKELFNVGGDIMPYYKTSCKGDSLGKISAECSEHSHGGRLHSILKSPETNIELEKGTGSEGGSAIKIIANHPKHGRVPVGGVRIKTSGLFGTRGSLVPAVHTNVI
jgi:gas vesicle protein